MPPKYYIVDTKNNRFYMGETEYIPWILNAFTDSLEWAFAFEDEKTAKETCERFMRVKCGFDGNTPLDAGRLAVMKMGSTMV